MVGDSAKSAKNAEFFMRFLHSFTPDFGSFELRTQEYQLIEIFKSGKKEELKNNKSLCYFSILPSNGKEEKVKKEKEYEMLLRRMKTEV